MKSEFIGIIFSAYLSLFACDIKAMNDKDKGLEKKFNKLKTYSKLGMLNKFCVTSKQKEDLLSLVDENIEKSQNEKKTIILNKIKESLLEQISLLENGGNCVAFWEKYGDPGVVEKIDKACNKKLDKIEDVDKYKENSNELKLLLRIIADCEMPLDYNKKRDRFLASRDRYKENK